MSITISLKQAGEERDVVIPTEWTDMTLEYWCGMYMVIKKHQDIHSLIKPIAVYFPVNLKNKIMKMDKRLIARRNFRSYGKSNC